MQNTGPGSGPFRSERGSAVAGITLAVSVLAVVGFNVTPRSAVPAPRDAVRFDAATGTASDPSFTFATLVRTPEIVSAPAARTSWREVRPLPSSASPRGASRGASRSPRPSTGRACPPRWCT
jgi:hypothetical protein